MSDPYNYRDFVLARETPHFEAFRNILHVGDTAPDGALIRVGDGAEVRLADYHRTGPLVAEFGSFT